MPSAAPATSAPATIAIVTIGSPGLAEAAAAFGSALGSTLAFGLLASGEALASAGGEGGDALIGILSTECRGCGETPRPEAQSNGHTTAKAVAARRAATRT